MEPDVKQLFRKILNTIAWFLLWLMAVITAGLRFGLAFSGGHAPWVTVAFYIFLLVSLAFLALHFYRLWSK